MAETNHRLILRRLATAVGAQPPNRRTIVSNISQAEASYAVLTAAHIAYVHKIGASMDAQEHQGWINTKDDAHTAGIAAATNAVELIDVNPANAPPARPLETITSEKLRLTLRINALYTAIEEALPDGVQFNNEQHAAMTENLETLEGHLRRFEELITELKAVDVAQIATYQAQLDAFMAEKIPMDARIRINLARSKTAQVGAAPPPAAQQVAPANPQLVAPQGNRRVAKLIPISGPKFTGKAKDYPQFKIKYEEMVTPHYDSASRLEYLHNALPQAVKDKLAVARKSEEQIWRELDEWFGNDKVVLKETLADLYDLPTLKLKPAELVPRIYNTLADTEALLDGINKGVSDQLGI